MMQSDCERYLEKLDRRQKVARKISWLIISCILLGFAVYEIVDLIPRPEPEIVKSRQSSPNCEDITIDSGSFGTLTFIANGIGDAIEISSTGNGNGIDIDIIELENPNKGD